MSFPARKAERLAAEWLDAHAKLPPYQDHPGPFPDANTAVAPANAASSKDRRGRGYVVGTCPGKTYVSICNGQKCEYGAFHIDLPAGLTVEQDVEIGSGYCISCSRAPDLSDCQKMYLPLR